VIEVKKEAELTFGAFIRKKRLDTDPHISLRKFAEMLSISPVYVSNIETDRLPAPKEPILSNMAKILSLDKHEQEQMYDLAANSKTYTAVPDDLPEYISTNEYARIALRVAKDVDATDTEWIEFIEKLKKRGGG
jgi:transcriptional regulator with XRE-family HTH domain